MPTIPGLADVVGDLDVASTVERTRDPEHGDFASNVAMRLAKPARKSPRDIATSLAEAMQNHQSITSQLITKIDIAGPGFINFHLESGGVSLPRLRAILETGRGRTDGKRKLSDRRILLEFISANPTGPLHVGHGRHAAYGATLEKSARSCRLSGIP